MRNVAMLHNPVLAYRPDSSVPVNITAVAERIARTFGGELLQESGPEENPYYMPFAAVNQPLADEKGITGQGDVYGGIVRSPQHADKAILHELPNDTSIRPEWYSHTFARAVAGVVLPGFTTFTPEDTAKAFDKMQAEGLDVRFKDPSNTGGLGQTLVRTNDELIEVIAAHGAKFDEAGAIAEVDLVDAATVTIGYVNLGGNVYTWHGRPYDVQHNGMTRFGGNELTVVRGDLQALRRHCINPHDRLAIYQATQVINAYDILGATISRATLDAVQGTAANGKFMSGITDPSLRPSASSAAEIRAIEAFAENPDAEVVTTRLTYDYAKELPLDNGSSRELFVNHKRMNIFVELVDIT